jgi:hypothetical protein
MNVVVTEKAITRQIAAQTTATMDVNTGSPTLPIG